MQSSGPIKKYRLAKILFGPADFLGGRLQRAWRFLSRRRLRAVSSLLLVAVWTGCIVWVRVLAVYPLRDEVIVLVPDEDLRSMTALSIHFGQLYCRAERLRLAGVSRSDVAIGVS